MTEQVRSKARRRADSLLGHCLLRAMVVELGGWEKAEAEFEARQPKITDAELAKRRLQHVEAIRQAAELWGTARSSFLLHARGIEHHTHGVQNCLGAINIVLATGRIGRPVG